MKTYDTVHGVVTGYIDKLILSGQKLPPEAYWPLMRHAISWFNQRDRVLAPSRATTEIMLQDDRSALLPDDFVDWLVVGKLIDGQVVNLGFNPKVSRLPPSAPQVPVQPPLPVQPQVALPSCYVRYEGYLGGDLIGYGEALYPGEEFTIDVGQGMLYTNSEVAPGPLYLHYVYNSDKPNERTPILSDHALVLEYWMEWQMNRLNSAGPTAKANYYAELLRVSRRANPFTLVSLYEIVENTAYGY